MVIAKAVAPTESPVSPPFPSADSPAPYKVTVPGEVGAVREKVSLNIPPEKGCGALWVTSVESSRLPPLESPSVAELELTAMSKPAIEAGPPLIVKV